MTSTGPLVSTYMLDVAYGAPYWPGGHRPVHDDVFSPSCDPYTPGLQGVHGEFPVLLYCPFGQTEFRYTTTPPDVGHAAICGAQTHNVGDGASGITIRSCTVAVHVHVQCPGRRPRQRRRLGQTGLRHTRQC